MSRPINISETNTYHPTSVSGNTNLNASSSYPTSNSLTDSNSTTYTRYSLSRSRTGYTYYNFTISDIPDGATISSLTATVRIYVNNTGYVTNTKCQFYSNTTAKGSNYTFASTSNSNIVNMTNTGSWTVSELENLRLRIEGTGSSSNYNKYIYMYGATITISYTLQGTEYTITASSTVSGATASPTTQDVLEGEDVTVRVDAASLDDYKVTDNDVDVTTNLIRHNNVSETYEDTFIPSSFDSTNSVYNHNVGTDGVYSTNYINNGLTNHTSSTRCALYAVRTNKTISKMYYNFDCSDIPANAIINSVSCQIKAGSQGSTYYSAYQAYLCSGTTNKTSAVSITGSNTSPSTQTISGGTWTRSDLNNIKILFQVTANSSTDDSTWSFYGATLTVDYTIPANNPYYWTYELTNVDDDHVILIEQAGAYIPPEEDPQYTYWPITISSINATTDPPNGTTRVIQGTNQTITISPTDPQLTLALDNGVDITSQLVGGIPTNTYTVTTQVSGATYGFELNSNTGYYVSTNDGVSKSASVARLNMDFESSCTVTIQYINYAEANYDYGMFGKLDTAVATDGLTAGSNSSSPSDSTSNYQLAMASNSSSAQTITYTVPSGQHFIDIKYGKDDASDSGNDNLQWKVLSIEATSTSGDYTYTLTNVNQKHSLIFVFGNVNYYFITSQKSGACKIFPDGQSVVLEGGNYSINIVPDVTNATVTLTDNGVDRTNQLERLETIKNGVTYVSFKYDLSNIQTTHTLNIQVGEITTTLYYKENNNYHSVLKAYIKINGNWVEQVDLTSVFNNSNMYRKG